GVIEESQSPWSAPIVLAKKPDGSTRICVDYRALNRITEKDAHPLPRVDESFSQFAGAKYFTSLDLKSGYWQIPLDEDSKVKTAFSTRCGAVGSRSADFILRSDWSLSVSDCDLIYIAS